MAFFFFLFFSVYDDFKRSGQKFLNIIMKIICDCEKIFKKKGRGRRDGRRMLLEGGQVW